MRYSSISFYDLYKMLFSAAVAFQVEVFTLGVEGGGGGGGTVDTRV